MQIKPFKIKSEFIFVPKETEIEIKMLFVCDKEPNAICGENPHCDDCGFTEDIQRAKRFDLIE